MFAPAPPHSICAARHRVPRPRARARRRTRASPAPGVGCAPAAASPLPAATLSSTLTLALALAPALAATLTSSLALALAPAPALTPSRHGVLRAALASPSILHAAHDGQPAALCPQVRGHLLALTLITDHGPNPNPHPDQAHGGQPALAQRDGLPCGAGTGQPRAGSPTPLPLPPPRRRSLCTLWCWVTRVRISLFIFQSHRSRPGKHADEAIISADGSHEQGSTGQHSAARRARGASLPHASSESQNSEHCWQLPQANLMGGGSRSGKLPL